MSIASAPVWAKLATDESREFYDKAVEQSKQGNLNAAIIELKNALQLDPTNGEARLLLGEIYLVLGNGASAEKELDAADSYGIDESRTVVKRGHALLLQDRFTEILSGFDPALYSPDVAFELRLLRADAQAGLRQFAEARAAYDDARAVDPRNPRIPLGHARIDLLEGNFDAVDAHAQEALAITPNLAEANLLRGEAQRLKGQPEGAIPFYRAVIDGGPAPYLIRARAHLGLAGSFMALGRDPEAEMEITAFKSILPYWPQGPYLAAIIKLRARDYIAARQVLEEASHALERYTPAGFLYGIVYFEQGELELARAWLNVHLAAHPENLPARKLQGATLLRLGAYRDAVPVLEIGLKQAPDDPQLLLQLGSAYTLTGRAAEATELLKRAAEFAPQDPRVLGQLAISYVARGQQQEALTLLDTTLDLGPEGSATGYALAFVHLRTGAYDDALKVAKNLREHFPDDAVALNLEGAAYTGLRRPDEARKSFEAALAIEPEYHEARANLAALKAKEGDFGGAESDYSRILASNEKNVPALMGLAGIAQQRGDAATSRNLLLKAVEADRSAIHPAMTLAEDYASAGELLAALNVVSSLALYHSHNPRVLFTLGRLQSRAGRFADAVATYRRLVDATNGATEPRNLLAEVYVRAGDADNARSVLEESLRDNPDYRPTAEALVALITAQKGPEAGFAFARGLRLRYPRAAWSDQFIGDLHLRAGRVEEALAEYEAGWAKKPSADLAVALSLARLKLATKQGKHEMQEVLAPLQQWLDSHPDDDTVRLALAETQLNIGDHAAATKEYEALKATEAENPSVWNNLAWLYHQVADARAVEHGRRALELAPDRPEVMDTVGWILLDHGQVDEAVALLRKAHQAAPDNATIAFHWASALHRSGDDSAAKDILQTLLQTGAAFPEKPEAEQLLSRLR